MPFFKVSENFLSSALATMITKAILQPVDTCKTRAQSSRNLGFKVRFVDILVDALKKEKPIALFRGLPAAWLGSIPAQSLYISTYESCKYLFLEKTHLLPKNVGIALSAAIGDLVAGFIRVPPETIKQRLQTGLDLSTGKAIRRIYQTQGLKGFYRGYLAQKKDK
ncbi:Probable S-adenosylmethionine carrier 2, chloroplastic [Galdieria sulphuraria]|nr:Probable S-adenosylmethionine carrier 2, chloroplastic [Galdieria sulphuraria]